MGLFGGSKFDKAFREYEMPKDPGFWQGGDKFRFRDGLAGLLAAIGDGFAQSGGGEADSVDGLLGGRFNAMELAKKKAAEQAKLQQMMAVGNRLGLSSDQVMGQQLGLHVPEQRKPHVFKDNAGNLMEYDFETSQVRPLSVDPADRTYFNNGAMVTVPNPRRNMGPTHTIGGEDLPIPRLGSPTPEEAAAELRRRRGY